MRRAHRKTRNGCSACKRRRVKCDERKPSCANCERVGLQCSLEFLTPAVALPRRSAVWFHQTRSPALEPSLKPHSLDMKSLELLHHYTSFTCLTIGAEPNMKVWQESIPQMAMSDDFLMLGMLSVSALHLAYLQPQRRDELVKRASIAKERALIHYNRDVSFDDPRTLHSALAFGGFVVPYILAQPGASENSVGRIPSLNDSSAHWFHVIRGLVQLTIKGWQHLIDGPFGGLLTRAEAPIIPEKNPDDSHLKILHRMLDQSVATTSVDEEAIAVCRKTLEELRRVAAVPYTDSKRFGILAVINIWPGSISFDFVVLLHQRRPEALVILAHYCVLLKRINNHWFIEGVGRKMLATIAKTLDERWLPWIEWAIEQPEIWDEWVIEQLEL